MPSKKEPSIAIPTNAPERQPSAPTMIIITSNTALIMLFSSSLNIVFIFVDRSCENVYLGPSSQFFTCSFYDGPHSLDRFYDVLPTSFFYFYSYRSFTG